MDTIALQKAFDYCHESGGGTVIVPRGRYLTAALRLRSNLHLHLEKDAVLLGSTDPNDYPEWQGEMFHAHLAVYNARYLLGAEGEENISITGEGTIDGQGFAHYDHSDPSKEWWPLINVRTRPGRMIFFALCRNVRIDGITCLQSPAWTFWMAGCERVVFHNVTINTDWRQINTDGIDIDCCRDVQITHCNICTGDDAIVLRAIDRNFRTEQICEQIRVENCTLSSNCNAIRLSYLRDGVMRNITMQNLTIRNSRRGITCQVPTPQETPEQIDPMFNPSGPTVENIRFTNIRIEADRPIWFRVSELACVNYIGNIRFENIEISGTTPSLIQGNKSVSMTNFVFENIKLVARTGTPLYSKMESGNRALGVIFSYCDNLIVRNFRAEGGNAHIDAAVPLFHFEDVETLALSGIENGTDHETLSPLALDDVSLSTGELLRKSRVSNPI